MYMAEELLTQIKRSDNFPYIVHLTNTNNKGYISIDTHDWTAQMFYELPSIKFDIYVDKGGERSKYNPVSYVVDTYTGLVNGTMISVSIKNIPEDCYIYIYPIFDKEAIMARNALIKNGIEDGDIWTSETDTFDVTVQYLYGKDDAFPVSTITGIPPISFKADGKPLTAWSIAGNGQQTGTPSPQSIIMPDFCGVRTGNLFDKNAKSTAKGFLQDTMLQSDGTTLAWNVFSVSEYVPIESGADYYLSDVMSAAFVAPSLCFYDSSKQFLSSIQYQTRLSFGFSAPAGAAYVRISYANTQADAVMLSLGLTAQTYEPYGYKIPITNAGQTVPVYLGQVNTVRRIKKLVLTGEETGWYLNDANHVFYRLAPDAMTEADIITSMCTHYKAVKNKSAYVSLNNGEICIRGNDKYIWICDSTCADLDAFKAYLAAQYAAGTPVTVWYVLATPETAIVNEPLAKIGDYADELHSTDAGVTIPTAKGQNVLTVDTELQPSSMTITGNIKPL